jgi:hypothetical protein
MKERIVAYSRRQLRTGSIVKTLAFCLPIMAVVLACSLSFSLRMPISIEKPIILVLGAIFILIPLKVEVIARLQQITGFYLIIVVVSQLSSNYFTPPLLPAGISVSYSIVFLFLCTTGYLLEKIGSHRPLNTSSGNVLHSWIFALAIIVVHMVLLSLVLNTFYDYGYERNLAVLGNLILYFLLFLVLWRKLYESHLRRCIGLVMTIFYLVVMFAQQGP